MRPRAVLLALLGSAAVLAAGWQIGARPIPGPAAPAPATGSARTPQPTTSGTNGTNGTNGKASSATALPSGTFRGTVVQTQYGPVQVEAIIRNGRIADVRALQLTDRGGRSVAISAAAAPQLRTEALAKQSAHIDTISGATYTSDGYTRSLQAALDRAGL